jgi:hypothetical protein
MTLAQHPPIISPHESSSLLGLLRNVAPIAPLRVYLSLHAQYLLNEAIQQTWVELSHRW